MKKILIFVLIAMTSHAQAEIDFVPLDMELGYWEITTEMNLDDMLANVPAAQREMMREMMKSKVTIPVVKQCITKETFKNMKKEMMENFKSAGNDCTLKVLSSSSQEFSAVVTCADNALKTTIDTKAINSKRHESVIVSNMAGAGNNNIKTIGEWKSATCPAGI